MAKHAVFTRMQPDLKAGTVRDPRRIALRAASNCWICEGWSEFQFDFTPKEPVDELTEPVRLHLSCDGYEGELLDVDKKEAGAANKKAA